MKKVLFIQLKGKSFGGIWHVVRSIGECLIDNGYEVTILSLRENQNDITLEYNPKLNVETLNKKDIWEENYFGTDIINDFKKIHLISAIKKTYVRIKHEISIIKDKKNLHKYIRKYNPDYIVSCHYELIEMIPKDYLNKTIHQQHTSFGNTKNNRSNIKIFNKYKNKIKFLWLTKKTMEEAIENGLVNSDYIYNPVRFTIDKIANVIKNKKLITIARISKEKRIDYMVDIVEKIFEDSKFNEWTFEIFGLGEEADLVRKKIKNHKQIKMMGLTDNPKKELLSASINLNTSSFEGFSLSILEANECGVPTVTFDFGESVYEEIINEKTGIIAKDKEDYIDKLKELMLNKDKLTKLSENAKKFSQEFHTENIINEWILLFNELDKQNNK